MSARGTAMETLRWVGERRRIVAPAAFAVILVVNLGLLYALGPAGEVRSSQAVQFGDVAGQDPPLRETDEDRDGVADLDELLGCGTSTRLADTDADGMPDEWECRVRQLDTVSGAYVPDPLRPDSHLDPDRDSLTHLEEYRAARPGHARCPNPLLFDSDGDGLSDGYEVRSGLDPCALNLPEDDLDEDGLTDFEEARLGTMANRTDTDEDGLGDKAEVDGITLPNGTRIRTNPTRYSTGGSGIADGWLVAFGLDPRDPSVAYRDLDRDDLVTLAEFTWSDARLRFRVNPVFRQGLDPGVADRDQDGIPDGWEVANGLDPLVAADASIDSDLDGLANLEEFAAGSNPHSPDTDGDGLSDLTEVRGVVPGSGLIRCVGDRPGAEKPETCASRQLVPWKSDPRKVDSDLDGLTDRIEWEGRYNGRDLCGDYACTLDPLNTDSDLDGLTDFEEVTLPLKTRRLNPLLDDTDRDGLKDGAEYEMWTRLAAEATAAQLEGLRDWRGKGETIAQVRELLLPTGNLHEGLTGGNDLENIVDPDSDSDTLTDGEEVAPIRKTDRVNIPHPWPATHPGLADTDRDGLDDGWEKSFSAWDEECGVWNLDPVLRNSYAGPCKPAGMTDAEKDAPDGQKDLDDDHVRYLGDYVLAIDFPFTNLLEYRAGTDPNDPDTDNDGADDGWEAYFGQQGIPLSPRNGQDINATARTPSGVEKSHRYVRVNASKVASHLAAAPGETRYTEFCDPECYPIGRDSLYVAHWEGLYRRTYLDEFRDRTNPLVSDTDGDGLPDAWEAFWRSRAPASVQEVFDPISRSGATANPDDDDLTNYDEYQQAWPGDGRFMNPLERDTDFGGLHDGQEVFATPPGDPLNPADDAPEGDPDHDGLVNREELDPEASWAKTGCALRGTCLRINDFDSDNDGLLDGPDSPLWDRASAPWVDEMLSRGILVLQRVGDRIQFAGELGRGTDPTKVDSDGDGMPDGYEVCGRDLGPCDAARRGQLDPTNPSDGVVDHDRDGILTIDEYSQGRPATWKEATHGPWWFGSNPLIADSDGDGLRDGRIGPGGVSVGDDFDLDNDGLHDGNGEDPFPYFDPDNAGSRHPLNRTFAREWLAAGRSASVQVSDTDGAGSDDGVPNWRDRATGRIELTAIRSPAGGGTIFKGGAAILEGRVVVDEVGADTPTPVPGVVVVANLVRPADLGISSADRSRAVGVALTGSDGTFRLEALLTAARSVTPGPIDLGGGRTLRQAVVFGEVRSLEAPIQWTLNTSAFSPGGEWSWVVWSYSVSAQEERYGLATTCANCQRPFVAEGVSGTFAASQAAEVVGPAVDPLPSTRTIRANASIVFDPPPRLRVANERSFMVSGRLVETLTGDAIRAETVALTWRGTPLEVLSSATGAFSASFAAGSFTEPTLGRVDGAYAGRGPYSSASASREVVISFPVTLTGEVATAGLSVLAGETIDVRAQLLDVGGRPIAGGEVTATLPGLGLENRSTTDALGRVQIRLPVPADASVGPQAIQLVFAGSDFYQSAARTLDEIVAIRQKSRIQSPAGSHPVGKDLVVEGNLTDAAGRPLVDPTRTEPLTVVVTLKGFFGEARVESDGQFRLVVPAEVNSVIGPRAVTYTFPGTSFYSDAIAVTFPTITSGTRLSLRPDPAYPRGSEAVVRGTVLDDLGRGVPAGTVLLDLGEWNGTAKLDAGGAFAVAVTLPADAGTGPTPVRARYPGSGPYQPALPVATAVNVVAATRLELLPATVPSGTLRLNATLRDDSGNPVGGSLLRFRLAGVEATAVTDSRGLALTTYEGSALRAGNHRLEVTYDGSLLFGPASGASTVTILARTSLTFETVPVIVRGSDLALSGKVTEEGDRPVRSAFLVVTLNGTRLGTIPTGTDGTFAGSVPVPLGFPRGFHPLTVTYPGDEARVPASHTLPIEVKSAVYIEVLIPGSLRVGEAFTGRILLRDDTGEPVPDALLRVRFSGYHHPFTLKTNESGISTFPGRVSSLGSSDLSVTFPGEHDLAGAQQTRIIEVESAGLLPGGGRAWAVAVVAALAILATASLMLARFRRRQFRAVAGILGDAQDRLLAGNEYVATILHAYKRLTDHFVRFGYVERADVTPQEFAAAARAALPVRSEPLDQLIHLFEEARYSNHPVGAAQRDEALAALASLNRDIATLARTRPPLVTPEGEAA